MALGLAIALGLCVGSFFNVVIYRLPRGESLSQPPSHCPVCDSPIKPYDNIPVISWLVLRGRCRACNAPISPRYPAVEALTAALAAGVVLSGHGAHGVALGCVLVAVLVPAALIDLDVRKIPNLITGLGAGAALAAGLATEPAGVPTQLLWGAAAGGFLLVFALLYPAGMGMGDVKLAAVMGLCLGRSVVVAMLAGLLLATAAALVILAVRGVNAGRKTAIALGPFLAVGGVVALYAGPHIVHWYLHTVV